MAETHIEADPSCQPSLEVPVDDDLINYESDAADRVEDATIGHDSNHDVDALLDDVIAGKDVEAVAEGLAQGENVEPQEETNTADPFAPEEMKEGSVTLHTDDIDFAAGADSPKPIDAAEQADAGDEIDYSVNNLGEQSQSVEDTENRAGSEPQGNLGAEQIENPEINWEQEEATLAEGAASTEDNGEAEMEQHGAFHEEQDRVLSNESEKTDKQDGQGAGDNVVGADDMDEGAPNTSADDSVEDGDDVPTQAEGGDDSADSHFPSITVQYQGDEFPFFSYSADGFFSDESILNEGMQALLQSFRSQLSGDIAAEDELVFQIDELGLEFSESNTSSFTMHQVLEIFDLLVKNDDPDGVRTLYTYLFVRPNIVRRYELLVESATSGKGLDEISYLFPQQVSHKNNVIDNGESLMIDGMPMFHDPAPNATQANEEHAEEDMDHEGDYQNQEDDDQYGISAEFDEAIENAGDRQLDETHDHEQETSTTSTLQGDGDTVDASVDADTETAVDNDAEEHLYMADTADFAEIDWRDENEVTDDLLDESGLAAAKRARDSDDLELENEKGVKRRRP